MTDLAWLHERFARARERTFLVQGPEKASYGSLLDGIARWREKLRETASAGTVFAVESDYSADAVALLLALIERSAIAVPLTDAVKTQKAELLEIAEVEVVAKLEAGRESVVTKRAPPGTNPLTRSLVARGEPGLVLFTSGSTGKPKGVLHDFALLLEKFKPERLSLVTMPFLMFDHIGGLNTLLYVLSNTGTLVVPPGRDPDVVCEAIAKNRVELLPTSPTFLNLLLITEAWRRHDLASLKRVTYGTEVMPARTLERIREVLPKDVELQQTYGLSEIGILRSKSRDSASLWVKVGGEGYETKVVDGTLRVKARSAMLGYLNAPSPFDADGWLDTGDAVEVEGEWLKILGRKSEIVNVGGQKVYPAEVEGVLQQLSNVRDVTVSGEKSPITGQMVVARFNLEAPEDLASLKKRVREHCRERLPAFKAPQKVEIVTEEQWNARWKKMRRRP